MKNTYILIIILLIIVGLFSLGAFEQTNPQQELNKATTLIEGILLKKGIVKKEKHYYSVYLKNGEAIIAAIEQIGIDVVIDVFDPNHQLVKSIDGSGKTENIDVISTLTGSYSLEIYPFSKTTKKGNYNLHVKDILSLKENTKRIAKKEILSKKLYQLWENSLINKNAVKQFIKAHKNKHIIEPVLGNTKESRVTYFYVPSENTEYIMQSGGPDFMGLRFVQLAKTKLYYASHIVPNDAVFNYGFNEFKEYRLGGKNKFSYREMLHVYDGYVLMPEAIENQYNIEKKSVLKGLVKEFTVKSVFLNEDRKITVHLPVGYDASKNHNLMILFDGEQYGADIESIADVPSKVILDNLHADKKISPTVTILVWNLGKRDKDLISDHFGNFIANELVDWARKRYTIGAESKYLCVGGSSRGGYAASLVAFNHSEIIGNVLSQSGSYWITSGDKKNHWMYPEQQGKLILAYKNSSKLPIKFYMDVGLYDAGASMLGMNREFRSILELKGYQLDYNEFKGGHGYLNWKQTLSNGIISVFGIEK